MKGKEARPEWSRALGPPGKKKLRHKGIATFVACLLLYSSDALVTSSDALCSVRSFLLLVVMPGAPLGACQLPFCAPLEPRI